MTATFSSEQLEALMLELQTHTRNILAFFAEVEALGFLGQTPTNQLVMQAMHEMTLMAEDESDQLQGLLRQQALVARLSQLVDAVRLGAQSSEVLQAALRELCDDVQRSQSTT
jgi:hypothetical protein